jgi:L-ascorbate metabolism protein UlaG (beta-lactamase superfamily)
MIITWFGHSSFKIEYDNKVIYLNPYAGEHSWYDKQANLVLVSSFEFDHWNRKLITQVSGDNTHVFGPPQLASEMYGVRPFAERQALTFDDETELVALASNNEIGWVISTKDKTIYFAAHEILEEPYHHDIDIAVVPVGGQIPPTRAADAVKVIKPKIAIPTHYGRIAGTLDDAELFKEFVEADRETQVVILEVNQPVHL